MQRVPPFERLTQIAFNSLKEKREIRFRGLAELRKGNISRESLQLGQKYQKEIERGFEPKISIRYVHRRVGYGVFAEERFKEDCFIGEYVGVVRENVRAYFAPLNNYLYEYPVPDRLGRNFVIDATKGNFTRFINHSAKPNLKPLYAFLSGFYHLIFIAFREIQEGEQLSYEYGTHYWTIRSSPLEL